MRARAVILAVLLSTVACNEERTCPAVDEPTYGFSLSPIGFPNSYDQVGRFYLDIQNFGQSGVLWRGPWRDDAENGTDAGSVPAWATKLEQDAETYCFQTSFVFTFREGSDLYIKIPENGTNSWLNYDAQYKFREMLRTFVGTYRPPFVFLGNENDFYYEQDRLDYVRWIEFYNQAYDDIHQISPGTKVGPVFSFEHISGGGILKGWTEPLWEAWTYHDADRVDVVGITVYPFFQYSVPNNIPADYLDVMAAQVGGKPLAITETGWPAENPAGFAPLWTVSEEQQVSYVPRLAEITAGKNVSFVNWLYLYPMEDDGTSSESWKTFGSISLKDSLGIERRTYYAWVDEFYPEFN